MAANPQEIAVPVSNGSSSQRIEETIVSDGKITGDITPGVQQ